MHWTGEVERVAFRIGELEVAWYGIILTTAMLIGLLVAIRLVKRMDLKSEDLLELFLIAIPLAIIGSRLGFVAAHAKEFFDVPHFGWKEFVDVIAIWDGGLTILTGGPAGILGALIWTKVKKVNFFKLADTVICVMLLSQGLGRWGNFCNQELYGPAVADPKWRFFPFSVYIAAEGEFRQASFFYEFLADLAGFGVMLFLSKRLYVPGSGLFLYGFFYGLIRFGMEFSRDSTDMFGIHNTGQLVCGIISVLCLITVVVLAIIRVKKGQRIWYARGVPAEFFANKGYPERAEQKTDPPPAP